MFLEFSNITDNILYEIFKVDLSFNDLLDAFVGSVNLTKNLYKQPDNYQVDYDKYILTYVDSVHHTTTTYKVDIRELSITDYLLKSDNQSVNIEGKYSGFELIQNVAVPFSIDIQNKLADQTLNIEYRNIIANRKDISIDFVLPEDAKIISW